MDSRATKYYRNESGRSSVNGPIDIRRMYRWLHNPAATAASAEDGGLEPFFGGDLTTRPAVEAPAAPLASRTANGRPRA